MPSVVRRLERLESRVPKPRAREEGPPFDWDRLTVHERAELEVLLAVVSAGSLPGDDARMALERLDDNQFRRLADLMHRAWGLAPLDWRGW